MSGGNKKVTHTLSMCDIFVTTSHERNKYKQNRNFRQKSNIRRNIRIVKWG